MSTVIEDAKTLLADRDTDKTEPAYIFASILVDLAADLSTQYQRHFRDCEMAPREDVFLFVDKVVHPYTGEPTFAIRRKPRCICGAEQANARLEPLASKLGIPWPPT